MKTYRFKFQWYTPDYIPTYSIEFSIDAYNPMHAQERAIERIKEAGYNDSYTMEFIYIKEAE